MPIENFAYPVGLKTVLKVGPILVVCTAFGVISGTLFNAVLSHPNDRIRKFHFRSNKFERMVRSRDMRLRMFYDDAISW